LNPDQRSGRIVERLPALVSVVQPDMTLVRPHERRPKRRRLTAEVCQFRSHENDLIVPDDRLLDIEDSGDGPIVNEDIATVQIHVEQPRSNVDIQKHLMSIEPEPYRLDKIIETGAGHETQPRRDECGVQFRPRRERTRSQPTRT